jgi:hypothetical protein
MALGLVPVVDGCHEASKLGPTATSWSAFGTFTMNGLQAVVPLPGGDACWWARPLFVMLVPKLRARWAAATSFRTRIG